TQAGLEHAGFQSKSPHLAMAGLCWTGSQPQKQRFAGRSALQHHPAKPSIIMPFRSFLASVLVVVSILFVCTAKSATEINLQLTKPGFVTLAIDDTGGKRIRNLLGEKWLEAGSHTIPWNGLDDSGEPVPAGDYHWKGLMHDGITTRFVG